MDGWWDYFRAIWATTLSQWDRSGRMSALGGAALAIPIAVLAALGISIILNPAINQFLYSVLVLWFVFLLTFVAPYKVWAAQRKEIKTLERAIAPELDVTYTGRQPCIEVLKDADTGRKLGRIHRVLVTNRSKTKTIKNVSVVVQSISDWDHIYNNTPLKTTDDRSNFNLDAEAEQYVNVFESRDGKEIENFRMCLFGGFEHPSTFVPRVPKEICLQVRGENTPSKTFWVRTGSTRGGKLTITEVERTSNG